jgi:hypothetical protein
MNEKNNNRTVGFIIGSIIQGLALGIGLFFALIELASTELGSQIFKYQGF